MHSQRDVLPHRQMGEEVVFLKQHRHRAFSRRGVGEITIIDGYGPAGRLQKAGNQIEQGAFPGTAWAKHRNPLALLNGEREAHRQMLIEPGYISQF